MRTVKRIYRPQVEIFTPALEITTGCSYGQCAFCTMYQQAPFRTRSAEEIEEGLQTLAKEESVDTERIFLLSGDPLALSTGELLDVAERARRVFGKLRTLSCYASINDIQAHSDEDWKALRDAGYNELYLGIETAYDPALQLMGKGYTAADAYRNLERLRVAGVHYRALLMPGIAGRGKGIENAEACAKLLNTYKPEMVLVYPLSVIPGSRLAGIRDQNGFTEATEREILEEVKHLLRTLEMEDSCYYFGSHPFNLVPVSGRFADRDKLIAFIENGMKHFASHVLDGVHERGPF